MRTSCRPDPLGTGLRLHPSWASPVRNGLFPHSWLGQAEPVFLLSQIGTCPSQLREPDSKLALKIRQNLDQPKFSQPSYWPCLVHRQVDRPTVRPDWYQANPWQFDWAHCQHYVGLNMLLNNVLWHHSILVNAREHQFPMLWSTLMMRIHLPMSWTLFEHLAYPPEGSCLFNMTSKRVPRAIRR